MNTSNPALRGDTFPHQLAVQTDDRMTVHGTIVKSLVLLGLLAVTFGFTWTMAGSGDPGAAMPWTIGGAIGGLVLSLVISFKPTTAPVLAPVFAMLEGLMLGGVSAFYENAYAPGGYEGIVVQAMIGTFAVFAGMLTLYRTGVIEVTDRFRAVVSLAMFGVFGVYLVSFLLSFAGTTIPYIHEGGVIGILFSVGVIVVASLMLLVDFDLIERGARDGAPKHMEWYGAFALLVTLIWLYIEILRLLSKLRR